MRYLHRLWQRAAAAAQAAWQMGTPTPDVPAVQPALQAASAASQAGLQSGRVHGGGTQWGSRG
ncbi:MAG: hypothetical protein U0836_04515 [Pirellulales bacterium]